MDSLTIEHLDRSTRNLKWKLKKVCFEYSLKYGMLYNVRKVDV